MEEGINVNSPQLITPRHGFINRRKMILEEISFYDYCRERSNLSSPTNPVDPEFDGFAKIVAPIGIPKRKLFERFAQTKGARRVCIYNGGWIRMNFDDFRDEDAEMLLRSAEQTGNLIYLCFKNGMSDNDLSDEIGFKVSSDNPSAVSFYCCIPGEKREEKCAWQGSDAYYREIHAVI